MSNDIFEPNDSRTSNGIVFSFSKNLNALRISYLEPLFFEKRKQSSLFVRFNRNFSHAVTVF